MKKMIKRIGICGLLAALSWSLFLFSDKKQLNNDLIRFHVVAHSDSEKDQWIKEEIKDTVVKSMQYDLEKISDVQEAKKYLKDNLPKIQQLTEQTLERMGFQGTAAVTLCREPFDIRYYDTFKLPSGVYHSLRIVIGDGLGKNWWCVSFPTLCIPATTEAFAQEAMNSGFSDSLVKTLSDRESCGIRFFFLDQLGKLENILFHG